MKPRKTRPRNLKTLDAILRFQFSSPDFVRVSEMVQGGGFHQNEFRETSDAVTEMEKKYIFFADEAATARKLVSRGHPCIFNVYFREP